MPETPKMTTKRSNVTVTTAKPGCKEAKRLGGESGDQSHSTFTKLTLAISALTKFTRPNKQLPLNPNEL